MDIGVVCSECGKDMVVDAELNRWREVVISVDPCEQCRDKAVEDAVEEAIAEYEEPDNARTP